MEKFLLFKNYQADNCGLSNRIISLELAIGIAFLTKRTLVFDNCNTLSYGEDKSDLKIDNVFKIPVPYMTLEDFKNKFPDGIKDKKLLNEKTFYNNVCVIKNEYVNLKQDDDFLQFCDGRKGVITLDEHEDCELLEIFNFETLCNYSYFFYIKSIELKKQLFEKIAEFSVIKHYADYVENLVQSFKNSVGSFNSIHIRRKDFETIFGKNNSEVILRNIESILPEKGHLIILTDDYKDKEFFKPITDKYKSHSFIDEMLEPHFKDKVLLSIISRLTVVKSNIFIGSLKSTYTSLIQRDRLRQSYNEKFLFHSTNHKDYKLLNCEMEYEKFGNYSWNGLKIPSDLKNILFWIRDFKESVIEEKKVMVYENFLTDEQSKYLIDLFKNESIEKEYYKNEHRFRILLNINKDEVCNSICSKIKSELDIENFELHAQLFKTLPGSDVKLHVDSLSEDKTGKRERTILVYLNDDYKGGELYFPKIATILKPKKNSLVTYKSFTNKLEEDLEHGAFRILNGFKYLLIFTVRQRETGFKVLKKNSKKTVIFIKRDGCKPCEGLQNELDNFKAEFPDIDSRLINLDDLDNIDKEIKQLYLKNKKKINFTPSIAFFIDDQMVYLMSSLKREKNLKQKINELF